MARSQSVFPPLSDKMKAKANAARKQLDTFCLIGEVLREDKIDAFTIGWMSQQLLNRYKHKVADSTIGDHLAKVEKLFEDHLPELGMLFDHGQGQRGYTVTPQGWRAWRIAMQIIGHSLAPGGLRS